MTARSPRGGRLDFSPAKLGANEPLDTYVERDHIASNLLHCADESAACVMFAWVAPDYTKIPGGTNTQWVAAPARGGAYQDQPGLVGRFGPYHLPIFGTGAYKIRARLLAATDSGAVAVAFSMQVGAGPGFYEGAAVPAGEYINFSATTSTTPTWLTPSPSGVLTLTQPTIESMIQRRSTLDDTSGVPASVDVCEFYVKVWCTGAGAGDHGAEHGRLYGMRLAAYVG